VSLATAVLEQDRLRVESLTTSGTFELDGGSWAVDNNVWLVGNDRELGPGATIPRSSPCRFGLTILGSDGLCLLRHSRRADPENRGIAR
jgi:hypothetical protein